VNIDTPSIGIHRDLPAEVYHSINAACNSRLGWMQQSPAHCRWKIDHPEQTKAMELGTAAHSLILQPGVFETSYFLMPDVDGRTKEGRAAKDRAKAENAGKIGLEVEDWDAAHFMRGAVMKHRLLREMIESATIELSAMWDDVQTQCPCRLRADGVVERASILLDLKTTEDASPSGFTRSIAQFRYHRQASFYLHGLAQCGVFCDSAFIVAIEKKAPWGVVIHEIGGDELEAGEREWRRLLDRYAECWRTGEWPAYPETINRVTLPAWALRGADQ